MATQNEPSSCKPRKKPSASLTDNCDPADESTYLVLVKHATEAVIKRQWDLHIRLPYFVKIADGFPRGVKTRVNDMYDVYKVKSRKVLDWLYENNYSSHNTAMIMTLTRELARLEGKIDKLMKEENA